jgi:hypothetical protein
MGSVAWTARPNETHVLTVEPNLVRVHHSFNEPGKSLHASGSDRDIDARRFRTTTSHYDAGPLRRLTASTTGTM